MLRYDVKVRDVMRCCKWRKYKLYTRRLKMHFHIFQSFSKLKQIRIRFFVKFMGCDGHCRVRTYGSGPSPIDIFEHFSSTIVGTTPSDRIQQMIERMVATRMAEYEARRDQEVEVVVTAMMVELNKRRVEDISTLVKQCLEFLWISIHSQASPRVRSSVVLVPTASSEYKEERLEDEHNL